MELVGCFFHGFPNCLGSPALSGSQTAKPGGGGRARMWRKVGACPSDNILVYWRIPWFTSSPWKYASMLVWAPLVGIPDLRSAHSRWVARRRITCSSCYPKGPCIRCREALSLSSGVAGARAPAWCPTAVSGVGGAILEHAVSAHCTALHCTLKF